MSRKYNFPKKLEIDIIKGPSIPNKILNDKNVALAPIDYDNDKDVLENEENIKTSNCTKFSSTVFLISCITDSSYDL